MMKAPTKAQFAGYLAILFFGGVFAGVLLGMEFEKHKFHAPPRPDNIVANIEGRLKSDLNLTDEQLRQIDPIIRQTASQIGAIHASTRERIGELFRSSNAQIRQYLRPEQIAKMEKLDKEREQFRRDHRGPRGDHPPGPR